MPLQILQTDIAALQADAVVCAANNYLHYDRFGASGALLRHADTLRLEEVCRQIGYCETGDAVITPSFGLPCTHLIHTVGPVWQGGHHNEESLLRSCYTRSLDLAREHGLRSVAFPLISSGARGYPREQAISIATSAIGDWLMNNDSDMSVLLTLFREPVGERYREINSYIEQSVPELSASLRPPREETASPFNLGQTELSDLFEEISAQFEKSRSERSYEYADSSLESFSQSSSCQESVRRESIFEDSAETCCESAPLPSAAPPPAAPSPAKPPLRSMRSDDRDSASASSSARKASRVPSKEHAARDLMRDDEFSAGIVRRLRNLMHQSRETFRDMLLRLIDERGLTDPEVYKRANLDRRLFSKIRSNPEYQPTKNTVLALCISLRLNLDQTTDLLRLAGFALSPTSKSDLIIQYFIDREIYDIHTVNEMLFEFDQKLLGAQ